jgi:hypothetical protein
VVVDLVAVLSALALAVGIGLPGLRRRQQGLRACLRCGRVRLLGEQTCDCAD